MIQSCWWVCTRSFSSHLWYLGASAWFIKRIITLMVTLTLYKSFHLIFLPLGHFSPISKLVSAFLRLMVGWVLCFIAAAIFFGILLGKEIAHHQWDAIRLTAILLSNTVGQIALMFLLGYGLIEFPRSLWNHSNLEQYRLRTQTLAAAQFSHMAEVSLNMSMAVSDAMKTRKEVKPKSYSMSPCSPHLDTRRSHVVTIRCPIHFPTLIRLKNMQTTI